ncbi:gluconokinase [Candidatus Falkowbacteria bacterium]|nr:gluconokinase [Candidatus Falkowbacteria bacterium]
MELVSEIIAGLEKPSAYSHPSGNIQRIITGVSVVFLTGSFAYKFNKPLNLGFLDFSTLEKRKEQCEKEVRYNSLISPELYLGVAAINKDQQGNITVDGAGEVIEYAVKMKQLDPNSTMFDLLKENSVTAKHISALAAKIFSFHQKALTNEEISSFGSVKSIQFNWDENFQQTEKYKPAMIGLEDFEFIQQKINNFIQDHPRLFEKRVTLGKIKRCHGDFHSANVFITSAGPFIFDGIVFNQRFPCSDVIAEIAFMAMDLERQQKDYLAEKFIQEYHQLSKDQDIAKLLPFYKCYRAYIRGKINCFTSEDDNLIKDEKNKAIKEAKEYFYLAKRYAQLL